MFYAWRLVNSTLTNSVWILRRLDIISIELFGSNRRHFSQGIQMTPDMRRLYSQTNPSLTVIHCPFSWGFSNVFHSTCVRPTAPKLGCVTNFDMLFLLMGFIWFVGEIKFMPIISTCHFFHKGCVWGLVLLWNIWTFALNFWTNTLQIIPLGVLYFLLLHHPSIALSVDFINSKKI